MSSAVLATGQSPFAERLLRFGPHRSLVGTLTEPALLADTAPAAMLFNAGFINRTGPHRINVRLARRLGAGGFPTLRFDLAGLGDSGRPDTQNVEGRAVEDLGRAVDALCDSSPGGARRVVPIGLCSGTDHCIAFALRDARVAGIVLVDPFAYPTLRTHWNFLRERICVSGGAAAGVAALRRIARDLRPQASDESEVAQLRRRPSAREFGALLEQAVDRGIPILVIHSGSFRASYNYAAQFDDVHTRLRGHPLVETRYFAAANHTFTTLSMQERLFDAIENWFAARFR